MILKDRRGRRWVCGKELEYLGVHEYGRKYFWSYDWLLKWRLKSARR